VPPLPYSRLVADLGLSDGHQMMIEAVPPGVRVLDVGCAGGYLARPLTEAGCTVVGVEPDPAAAESARGACASVTQGDFEDPAVRAGLPGPFDAVIFGDVLEHLRDPWAALEGTRPLLAPGARVIVSIPNIAHWSARLTILRGRFPHADSGLFDKTHLRFFTRRSAHELAERTGYTVEREQFTRWALPLGPFARFVPDRTEAAAARFRPELFALQFVLTLRPARRAQG
jgi:2-polyprenyl-3-methyl-5-hydroxy-6-metoxy-1,4-benzoquinol methylase